MSSVLSGQDSIPKAANRRRMVLLTLVLSIIFSIMPLPDVLNTWRPEWVAVVLIYWVMHLPHRFGVGSAWLIGLLTDATTGALLGQHAFGYALIAFFVLMFYRRIRVFPLIQQALIVGFMTVLPLSISLWVMGITGINTGGVSYWAPVLSSSLLWLILSPLLVALHRHFKIS